MCTVLPVWDRDAATCILPSRSFMTPMQLSEDIQRVHQKVHALITDGDMFKFHVSAQAGQGSTQPLAYVNTPDNGTRNFLLRQWLCNVGRLWVHPNLLDQMLRTDPSDTVQRTEQSVHTPENTQETVEAAPGAVEVPVAAVGQAAPPEDVSAGNALIYTGDPRMLTFARKLLQAMR